VEDRLLGENLPLEVAQHFLDAAPVGHFQRGMVNFTGWIGRPRRSFGYVIVSRGSAHIQGQAHLAGETLEVLRQQVGLLTRQDGDKTGRHGEAITGGGGAQLALEAVARPPHTSRQVLAFAAHQRLREALVRVGIVEAETALIAHEIPLGLGIGARRNR